MYRTCVFCQQQVLASEYSAHEAEHYRSSPPRQLPAHQTPKSIPGHDWGASAPLQAPAVSNALPMIAIGGIALALLVSCSGLIGAGLFMAGQRGARPIARPSPQQVSPVLPSAEQWSARPEPRAYEPPPLAHQPLVGPVMPPTIHPPTAIGPTTAGPSTIGPISPGPRFGPPSIGPGGMAAEHARRHQQMVQEQQQRMREMREQFRNPGPSMPQSIAPLPRGPVGP